MKKYYALIVSVLAMLAGSTGCQYSATKYGVLFPNDENLTFDEDLEETELDEIQTDIDIPEIDYDVNDTDVIEPDEDIPASKYGVQYTNYDSN